MNKIRDKNYMETTYNLQLQEIWMICQISYRIRTHIEQLFQNLICGFYFIFTVSKHFFPKNEFKNNSIALFFLIDNISKNNTNWKMSKLKWWIINPILILTLWTFKCFCANRPPPAPPPPRPTPSPNSSIIFKETD